MKYAIGSRVKIRGNQEIGTMAIDGLIAKITGSWYDEASLVRLEAPGSDLWICYDDDLILLDEPEPIPVDVSDFL